ncbi:MAG: aspartate carbamoyltransferase [Candidatus Firestonebacteria bacterium RIFOXYA2_FULL_40_8]|nr:MAG: aspartate carbamoyltransferase [Candidatus Firestonebacteria bacterium RIFOXYA2_FULL_40_8]
MGFKRKHLIGLEDATPEEIETYLNTAESFKSIFDRKIKKVPALRGRTVINLFFENSTRTRTSFELAAKRLSADVINFSVSTSSVSKGETLIDTAKTIEALESDMIVVRHSCSGVPLLLTKTLKSGIVNAGDGMHEHPTQGLLDLFTIREKKKKIKGLKIVMVGDIAHSRVARSNIYGMTKMGADLTLVAPPTLLPKDIENLGVKVDHDLRKAVKGADVVYMLRIQLERQKRNLFPSIREFSTLYGMDEDKLKLANKDAIVMHPGPMNRGVEISSEVADSEQSVICEQVTNGIAVRMAVLYLLAGGETNEIASLSGQGN